MEQARFSEAASFTDMERRSVGGLVGPPTPAEAETVLLLKDSLRLHRFPDEVHLRRINDIKPRPHFIDAIFGLPGCGGR